MSPGPLNRADFAPIEVQIQRGLANVESRHDGTHLNIFSGRKALEGHRVGIALSINPDSTIGYHVRKELPKNDSGNIESWDYHWGDRDPKVIHAIIHYTRVYSSSLHNDDVHESRDMDEVDLRTVGFLLDSYNNQDE